MSGGRKKAQTSLVFLALLTFLAACNGAPSANGNNAGNNPQQVATSTPIPTAPSVARPTYLVQRGDVQETLEFTGRWQPRDQQQLQFVVDGTVRRVNVRRGDTVKAGDLLADYQIQSLENQLADARLSLESAKTSLESGGETSVSSVADAEVALANAKLSLDQTKLGSPWTQVASAKVNLDNAQLTLDSAQRNYDDAISRANTPASQVDAAFDNLQKAKNGLRSAQISYDQAAQSWAEYQFTISKAENGVIQAEITLEKARRGGTDPTKAQQLAQAQLKVDQLEEQIRQSSLYAPVNGEVLEVDIKAGDAVKAFTTVIIIGSPEPKEVVASVAIGDAQKMSIGLVGVCELVNRPDTAVQCIVRRVPLNAREADQTTRVAASLDNVATNQIIQVDMPLQVRKNVLWLPPAAIRTFQNRTFVVMQVGDGTKVVDVQIGLQTDDRVEIESGVNEGDVIVGP